MSNTQAAGQQVKSNAPVQVTGPNYGERFATAVIREFGTDVIGGANLNDSKKRLVQGYFTYIDRELKRADDNRVKKNEKNSDHKFDNPVPVTWDNIVLSDLAKDIVINAKMGLDMTLPNHLYPIPYYNKDTKKYDINLTKGYNGIIHIAEKYALHKPTSVTVELVYSNDYFAVIKKACNNPVESYEFEIKQPFERGNILGGFGYLEFENPSRNKLVLISKDAIEKRKPKHASVEFWGGKKKQNKWNKDTKRYEETEEEVLGWVEEMYLKVIKREVYSGKYLPIDPEKIDENYQHMIAREIHYTELEAENAIEETANTVPIAEAAQSAVPPTQPPTDPEGSDPF